MPFGQNQYLFIDGNELVMVYARILWIFENEHNHIVYYYYDDCY